MFALSMCELSGYGGKGGYCVKREGNGWRGRGEE